jgi:hypothetical protein
MSRFLNSVALTDILLDRVSDHGSDAPALLASSSPDRMQNVDFYGRMHFPEIHWVPFVIRDVKAGPKTSHAPE